MNISTPPRATRLGIEDAGTIAAMEDLFAMLAGLIATTGGSFAIAGHDVRDTCVTERAQALTRMYDAGEVVVGYADARNGDIVNMVVEHLMLEPEHDRATRRPIWRILVYVEEPQGHELRGVIAGATWNDAAQQMLDAVTDGLRRPLPDQRTALNRILVARSN